MKKIFAICIILCSLILIELDSKMTLNDAIQLMQPLAIEWNQDAKLIHITSVDNPSIINDGRNGKRTTWTGVFHSSSQAESIILSATKGETFVLTTAREIIPKGQFINIDIASINSDQALNMAQEKYYLQPGTSWALGYNYTLYNYNEKTILCVFGEDANGYFTKVSFDYQTGQCLFAEHQIETTHGVFQWEEIGDR